MGGGVMGQPQLISLVRTRIQHILNGYVSAPAILTEIDKYIVLPSLGRRAGVLGAIALASQMGK
jgi:fructokinase